MFHAKKDTRANRKPKFMENIELCGIILRMQADALAYPFLFVAIFFESFVLVTFLSKPARQARLRPAAAGTGATLPSVAIVVPCFNEASTVGATTESLLALDYPKEKLEIILVDDGSSDATPEAMAQFADNPQVRIVRKENGGKHTALNAAIALTSADLIGCLDADSFVEPSALRESVPCFDEPRVAASTAAMSIHLPGNVLQHMQNAEYIFGITLRHALASINGLYVTPGPFSLYRRALVVELGGFRHGHQTEDLEMALRIQRAGYAIDNAPRARVYTKGPSTIAKLLKQRTRWTSGFMRNVIHEYRDLVGNRRYGALGIIVLPIASLAIMSGIVLFCLAALRLAMTVVTTLEVHAGIPLAYSFHVHTHFLDWFYFPSSMYVILGATTILASLALIVIGKHISKTPGSILVGLAAYAFLYGLIAPWWLMRAAGDVALGKKRGWR